MFNKSLPIMLILAFTVLPFTAVQAERSKQLGNYIVHYNALNTDFLKPNTARQYNIKRSKNRAMVTIAIQTTPETDKAMGQPVNASISGFAKNLNGQTRNLNFKLIEEGRAKYYIDDFNITNQEVIDFVLTIKPEGDTTSYNLEFRQKFFTK